jgi:hypothetical protein
MQSISQTSSAGNSEGSDDTLNRGPSREKAKSLSPATREVDLLSPDLACIGLSDQHAEQWSLKIIKLVAFPELIIEELQRAYGPSSQESARTLNFYASVDPPPISLLVPTHPLPPQTHRQTVVPLVKMAISRIPLNGIIVLLRPWSPPKPRSHIQICR